MFYKTQCEAVKINRQDFSVNDFLLSVGDVTTSYNFRDSKEKARLEFYSDLLDKYQYPVERIEFDVSVPFEGVGGVADIVVFEDDKRKISYIVVDCFKDEIFEADFEIGVKNVIAKAEALGADYAVCATRAQRQIIKLTRINGIIAQKIVSDLPAGYRTK